MYVVAPGFYSVVREGFFDHGPYQENSENAVALEFFVVAVAAVQVSVVAIVAAFVVVAAVVAVFEAVQVSVAAVVAVFGVVVPADCFEAPVAALPFFPEAFSLPYVPVLSNLTPRAVAITR